MREAVRGALDAVPERQPFLLGGVTFCGLVPQRSIPFRVVCLLGMNEGEFPASRQRCRPQQILGQPRHGDRDTRSEDRYLFLEALMSARDVLHISYIGEGVRDGKPRNPAAPLAELLQFLDEQHGIADDETADRPWRVRHPLQPFDARYYERDAHGQPRHDPRLFSYDPAFLAAPSSAGPAPLLWTPGRCADHRSQRRRSRSARCKRYWRDPAKDALLRGHGISLQALDSTGWPDREPLETGLDRLERVDRQLLFEALAAGTHRLARRTAGLAGTLGHARRRRHRRARPTRDLRDATATPARQARTRCSPTGARATAGPGDRPGSRRRPAPDRHGRPGLSRRRRRACCCSTCKPTRAAGLKEMLAFYIDWAALRLSQAGVVQGEYLEPTTKTQHARRAGLLRHHPRAGRRPAAPRPAPPDRGIPAVPNSNRCCSFRAPRWPGRTAQAGRASRQSRGGLGRRRLQRSASATTRPATPPCSRRGLDLFDPASPDTSRLRRRHRTGLRRARSGHACRC